MRSFAPGHGLGAGTLAERSRGHMIGGGTFQKLFDLRVGRLGKIVVRLPDGDEVYRTVCADDLVGLLLESRARFRRPDGDADNDSLGPPLAESDHRCPHARAGGDAIVHEDHGAAPHVERRALSAVEALAALQLETLSGRDRLHDRLGQTQGSHEVVIDDAHGTGGKGTHGKLLVPGKSQLAHDEDIERRVELSSYLESHRHTAARQGQHHPARAVRMPPQLARECSSRLAPIPKERHVPYTPLG